VFEDAPGIPHRLNRRRAGSAPILASVYGLVPQLPDLKALMAPIAGACEFLKGAAIPIGGPDGRVPLKALPARPSGSQDGLGIPPDSRGNSGSENSGRQQYGIAPCGLIPRGGFPLLSPKTWCALSPENVEKAGGS
jgi:hypothetical protein